MIVGIDASNIRSGGGVTHLKELLAAAEPNRQGVQHVIVWGGRATLGQLPERPGSKSGATRDWTEACHIAFSGSDGSFPVWPARPDARCSSAPAGWRRRVSGPSW
jgi:hypothetical protein